MALSIDSFAFREFCHFDGILLSPAPVVCWDDMKTMVTLTTHQRTKIAAKLFMSVGFDGSLFPLTIDSMYCALSAKSHERN